MKSFRTKQEVLVNPRLGTSSIVQVDVSRVVFNGIAFEGIATYSYFVDGAKVTMEETSAVFTIPEADALAAQGTLDGDTFSEKFVSLIVRATLHQFQTAQYYGIGAADWEIYVEPEPVVEEEEEEQPEE